MQSYSRIRYEEVSKVGDFRIPTYLTPMSCGRAAQTSYKMELNGTKSLDFKVAKRKELIHILAEQTQHS